jgi:hypothetical protein
MKPKTTFWNRFDSNWNVESDHDYVSAIEKKAIDMEVITLREHVKPIYKITGTDTSYESTMTLQDGGKWATTPSQGYEHCSWLVLLRALQGQEKTSREWERSNGRSHTINYFIQMSRGCWDSMPLNVNKPLAPTNICHLVEMISMLGLVWTEFDMKRSSLRAEGNGYIINSEHMPGLGVLARFSQVSRPRHEENRMCLV